MEKRVLTLILAAGLALSASAAGYMFILDASNSMNDPWTAGKTKIAWAKEALVQLLESIPADTPFGVVVFGHRHPGDPKDQSCADIEFILSYGVHGAKERAEAQEKIQKLTAKGWTPLANALKLASSAAPAGTHFVLLTDGEETCGGDPLAVGREMCKAGQVVDVVGISLGPELEKNLRALAEECGGKFILAQEAAELPGILFAITQLPAKKPALPCLAEYTVDPKVLELLVKHLPYGPCDPMWCLIFSFLCANPPEKIILGTEGDDVLFGTPDNDLIFGLGGNDQIFGFEGNDLLIGGSGEDLIQGGPGNDLVLGGPGNDLLFGGPGDDGIYGEEGDDRLEGELGNDQLFGGPGCDVILDGAGCNIVDGGPGENQIYNAGPCPKPPYALPAKTVEEGKSIVLRAEVFDPDLDKVTVTWSAPKGYFSDPHALETIYYAPSVTDCQGELIPVTVVAEDCCGGRSQDTITVHVLNVNHPPVVEAGPDLEVDEGQKIRLHAKVSDPDGDPVTVLWTVSCQRGSLDDPRSLTPL